MSEGSCMDAWPPAKGGTAAPDYYYYYYYHYHCVDDIFAVSENQVDFKFPTRPSP